MKSILTFDVNINTKMRLNEAQRKIKSTVKKAGGRWGIYARYLNKDISLGINEDKLFEVMSVIKLPILISLFKKFENREIDLKKEIKIERNLIDYWGSGILKFFSKEPNLRIYDIALLMMVVSDNSATNALIKLLGKNYINRFLKENGFKKTKLITTRISAKTFSDSQKYGLGISTPREISELFEKIIKGKLLLSKNANKVLRIMEGAQFGYIPLFLPYWWRLGNQKNKIDLIANKTGACTWEKEQYFSVRNEVAYIKTKKNKKFIITIFVEGKIKDHIWTDYNQISRNIGKVAWLIYEYFDSI